MSAAETTKAMTLTKDVLEHHLRSFGERDLKGILSDYAPGAVLFTPDGPLKGADAIRPLFEAMTAAVLKGMRWTYLGTGMTNPNFLATVEEISPEGKKQIDAMAPIFS